MNSSTQNTTGIFVESAAKADAGIQAFEEMLKGISDAQLHLADTEGGWTVAQIVSHIHMCGLLWIADLERMRHDSSLFIFREELGHDVVGAPPPSVQDAIARMQSMRHATNVCYSSVDPSIADKELEVTTIGKMTIAQWMDIIVGHMIGHTKQAEAILRSRGALPKAEQTSDAAKQ